MSKLSLKTHNMNTEQKEQRRLNICKMVKLLFKFKVSQNLLQETLKNGINLSLQDSIL